jgi:predicted AAA+ superfamily ATPase
VTISNYLNYLEQAFIVKKAIRYDIKGKRYIGTPSKYYFEDAKLQIDTTMDVVVDVVHLRE